MTTTPTPTDLPEALTASKLVIGRRYNWRGQPERLIYLGMCEPRNGRWHQFAKVDAPQVVWCEVLSADLEMLEATPDAALSAAAPCTCTITGRDYCERCSP